MKANKQLKIKKNMRLNVSGEWFIVTDISWDGVECCDRHDNDKTFTQAELKSATLWN